MHMIRYPPQSYFIQKLRHGARVQAFMEYSVESKLLVNLSRGNKHPEQILANSRVFVHNVFAFYYRVCGNLGTDCISSTHLGVG